MLILTTETTPAIITPGEDVVWFHPSHAPPPVSGAPLEQVGYLLPQLHPEAIKTAKPITVQLFVTFPIHIDAMVAEINPSTPPGESRRIWPH